MTSDRWLATIGVLVALPGFFELFLTGRQTEAALICLIAFIILCSAFFVRYIIKRPAFSAKRTHVKLQLDKLGKFCKVTKRYRLKPNHTHADRLIIRHNGGRGGQQDFEWNGDATIVEVTPIGVTSDYVATIKFSPSVSRGQWFEGELSYILVDSFTEKREFFIHQVEFAASIVTIEIRFPPDRPCAGAQIKRKYAASEEPVEGLELKDGGKLIEMTVRRPTVGSEYWIYWNW
jgi:hypothetical protein